MLSPASAYRSQSAFQNFPWSPAFPPAPPLLLYPILFGTFFGTLTMSDFSFAYMPGVWPQTFPDRSDSMLLLTDTNEISRFSSIECPRMHRFLDSAGSVGGKLIYAEHHIALPFGPVGRHPGRVISELNSWPTLPLSTLHVQPHGHPRMTRGHNGAATPFM